MSVEIAASRFIFEGKNSIYVMVSDETERKLIEQIIHESEERFRILFEGAPDAIILVDAGGNKILDSNPAASKLFKRPLDQLLKISHWDIFASDKCEAAKKNFSEILSRLDPGAAVQALESEAVCPDGTKIPVEISFNITTVGSAKVIQCIFREITLRKQTEEALKQSQQRLSRAQKISGVGSWELDLKTGIVLGNDISSSIYGFKDYLHHIPFEEIKALAHPNQREDLDAAMRSLITNGTEFKVTYTIRKKETGETRMLEARAELIRDENQKPVKVLGVVRDITELSNYQEQLILARENAERSDRLKSDFLAQMSHEIRSPVNIIMSYASLIKEELKNEANEEIKSCFNSIDNGGRRLIRTIDLILNMADIQSGKYEPFMEHTDLEKDILQNLISEYTPAVNEKGLKLLFTNEIGTRKVQIDRYTVAQIFSNLIDNAVKYTNEGEIDVIIQGSNDEINVSIRDTGIGISKEYIPHIFDPFSQEDQGYTRRFEGTGLGLSLVKKYCDLNGADIQVVSKKGSGTVFKVVLKVNTENLLLATYSNI